jgi:hypothetical protein
MQAGADVSQDRPWAFGRAARLEAPPALSPWLRGEVGRRVGAAAHHCIPLMMLL